MYASLFLIALLLNRKLFLFLRRFFSQYFPLLFIPEGETSLLVCKSLGSRPEKLYISSWVFFFPSPSHFYSISFPQDVLRTCKHTTLVADFSVRKFWDVCEGHVYRKLPTFPSTVSFQSVFRLCQIMFG